MKQLRRWFQVPIRYFALSAIAEALALTPLAVAGIGHAGPNVGWLWLGAISFLLNLPCVLFVAWLSSYWDFSWPEFVFSVYVVQTATLWLFGLLVTRFRSERTPA